MSPYTILLTLHGGLGAIALGTFWTAGLSRKGSPMHKAAGKIYLLAMAALLLPALPLALRILVLRSPSGGVFLLYLWILTVTSVWTSWRAIRDKRDWVRYTGPIYRALAWANLAGATVVLVDGLWFAQQMRWIFIAFSAIGLLGFRGMRRFARQAPVDPRWWLREHLGAMIANGVATHIAFLSIGLPKLLPMLAGPTLQSLAWLGPLAVSLAAGAWLTRKYLRPRAAAPATVVGAN